MLKVDLLDAVLPQPVIVQLNPSKVPSEGVASTMKSRLSFVAIELKDTTATS